MKIKDLKAGDFFTLRPIEEPKESQVWIRGGYDRGMRLFECTRFDDISEVRYMEGHRDVYIDFTF